jgi:hypothetical protein
MDGYWNCPKKLHRRLARVNDVNGLAWRARLYFFIIVVFNVVSNQINDIAILSVLSLDLIDPLRWQK